MSAPDFIITVVVLCAVGAVSLIFPRGRK